jgi:CBS domain-containing protein
VSSDPKGKAHVVAEKPVSGQVGWVGEKICAGRAGEKGRAHVPACVGRAGEKEATMRVHDVMSTGIVTALKSDTVRSVVVKMMNRNCGAIPVVEGDGRLVGMVTLRDVLLPLYPNYGDYIHDNVHSRDFVEMESGYPEVLGKKVEEIMTPNPLTVGPGDPILEAASYMGLKNFRRIPVVDRQKLVGMLSIGDINRGLFFESRMTG